MYFHGKTLDGNRYTITGKFEEDDLILGIAICSEKELFSKSRGREISTGRLNKPGTRGRTRLSAYAGQLGEEYRGDVGFPENYFVGREIKVFRAFVKNYNHFTKRELQHEFRLFSQT